MTISNQIDKAVHILRSGGLVAFPTETVYGLGADARNPAALKKIFLAKQRPMDHPLIVHVADAAQLTEWAVDITPAAWLLAEAFWPGPLTLILKKSEQVSDYVTGAQVTIGLRVPKHPVAQTLLKQFGGGLAAPSANRFGRISPTTAEAVQEELESSVDLILEGGACEVGVESTIVDVTGDDPVILRPGMITAKQIEAVVKKSVLAKQKNAPRVSGSLESHYAPRTKTRLLSAIDLLQFLQGLKEQELPVVCLSRNPILLSDPDIHVIPMPHHAKEYAHDLYQTLRRVDKGHFREIIIEAVPEGEEWDAIRDRLTRACG